MNLPRRKLHQQSWKCISPCQRWLGQAIQALSVHRESIKSVQAHSISTFCALQSFLASCSPSPTVAQVSCFEQLCGCSGQILLFCIPSNQLKTVCPVAEKNTKSSPARSHFLRYLPRLFKPQFCTSSSVSSRDNEKDDCQDGLAELSAINFLTPPECS